MSKEEQVQLIIETLEGMVGNSYKYGGATHRITNYRVLEERERVFVKTNIKEFDRDFESIGSFLNKFEPIQSLPVRQEQQEVEQILPVAQINSSVISECRTVLMDSIRKLKDDKNYISQAAAIKENVDTIIELGKVEVAQLELLYKLKRKGEI
jgi:hypothetical protein